MNIQKQIQLIRRIKADSQKEALRTSNQVILADLEEQINGLEAVIAILTKTGELLNALNILQDFNA